jgi:amino acid transporter
MAQHGADTAEGLVRAISARGLVASIVNATVGAGIFVLPAAAALRLGAAAPLAFFLCAVAMALVVACFAIAGSRVARSGGPYAYVERGLSPFAGFLAGVLLWLSDLLAGSGIAAALASSVAVLVPAVGRGPGRVGFVVSLVGLLALANVRGVRTGVRAVEAATALKLLPLLILVALGLFAVRPENLAWPGMPAAGELGDTVLLLVFAFVGVELALTPSGEVVDPARTVPRAAFVALGLTTLLYGALQLVAQGVLGPDLARSPDAPLAEAAARLLGAPGRALLVAGASVSMLGYLAGSLLGSPRTLFALGRDGFLPSAFARVHPRLRTPWVAITAHAAAVAVGALSGSFERLVVMSNVAVLAVYLLCAAAAWRLMREDVREAGAPLRLPGETVLPLLAGGVVLWILAQATAEELAVTVAVAGLSTAVYLLRRH